MRAALGLAALLLCMAWSASAPAEPAPLRVHVRVEGAWAQLWSGWVELAPTYTVVAENSGRSYTLDARTPLGALQATGLPLAVTDAYDDLVVVAVAGEAWWATRWWDYRVNWVQTGYGNQAQWLAYGPGLHDGDEVLWYPEAFGSTPLRLTDVGPAFGLPDGSCARAERVETLAADVAHEPGQPWPPVVWEPAPLSRLEGAAAQPVVGGATVARAPQPGLLWAAEEALPGGVPYHPIRSERSLIDCTPVI